MPVNILPSFPISARLQHTNLQCEAMTGPLQHFWLDIIQESS